jgi:hypothetical protein
VLAADSVTTPGVCRAVFAVCPAVFAVCRAVFAVCRAVFAVCRAVFARDPGGLRTADLAERAEGAPAF